MRPDERDLDDEIRGHLALSIKERIDSGEDPEAARRAALRELGYAPALHESMRRVWYGRWADATADLWRDIRIAVRSLRRARGLTATVVVTLALGIGANAAIFSVLRGVLLRPLVNRGEDRLAYIRQSAPGIGADNTAFSIPEIHDLEARLTTIREFGDFSTVDFTVLGVGDHPRVVKAGVVNGSFFHVMGLRPVLGRLLTPADDGPAAAGAVVLTHRFWTSAFNADPTVVGRTIRVGPGTATIVGVLEPSVPYPADTEIIANVVTSPHHLSATMVTSRTHRMTELFGRLAPGVSIEAARAEVTSVHAAMMRAHPEAYAPGAHVQVRLTGLRDQIAGEARTVLWLLLAAAAVVFVIACSNVANLILARSVRREGELAVRAALGAGTGALRRVLLAESLLLCGAGALLGAALAEPLFGLVARYAARFSVRATVVTVDQSVIWVGAVLAMLAAVLLAYVPRLPTPRAPSGLGLSTGGPRITPGTNRRLRLFATVQIAFSFVLLAGAGMVVRSLVAQQTAATGVDLPNVLVFDVPSVATGVGDPKAAEYYGEMTRRVGRLPGVTAVSVGVVAPWRDAGLMPSFQITVDGGAPLGADEAPHARFRVIGPNYFAVLGVPLVAGRDFTSDDRAGQELVTIVSQTLAERMFPHGGVLNHHLSWTDPVSGHRVPCRIVGVVADVDDENVVPGPVMTIYLPVPQIGYAQRLFVHATGNPYAIVPSVTRVIRDIRPEQAVERAATLEDVRSEILSPERLSAFVFSGCAGIALLVAAVGIAGVLAFSVSARTREFGVRLAVGSAPRTLLARVVAEGVGMAVVGVAAGAAGGYGLTQMAAGLLDLEGPGLVPAAVAAGVLIAAAAIASLVPAARASHVDVVQALRSE